MEEKDVAVDVSFKENLPLPEEEKPKTLHLASKDKSYHDAKIKTMFGNLTAILALILIRLIMSFTSLKDLIEIDRMIPRLQDNIVGYFKTFVVFGWAEIILSILVVVIFAANVIHFMKIRKNPLPTENLAVKKSYNLQKILLLVAAALMTLYFIDQLVLVINVLGINKLGDDSTFSVGTLFASFGISALAFIFTIMALLQFFKINKNLEEKML